MPRIKEVSARQILDSRGRWTLEACLVLESGVSGTASVPQGESRGSHEASVLPAEKALQAVNEIIAPAFKERGLENQQEADLLLKELDGTLLKEKLGANAVLAVSIACAKACAEEQGIPLWQSFGEKAGFPRLYANMINGGVHADNQLSLQEYLVIPKTTHVREAVEIVTRIYHELGTVLCQTKGSRSLGDEGGYAPFFRDEREPLEILTKITQGLGLADQIEYGIDAAGNNTERVLSEFPLSYMEDPYTEEEFSAFAKLLKERPGLLVAGDDLTTTNVERMKRAHAEKSINAIIIKPNQIGTITETLEAVRLAREYGWKVIVSHRSGETTDEFIADFAYGVGADGFKLGAPARGERVAKYNRLLEIEESP